MMRKPVFLVLILFIGLFPYSFAYSQARLFTDELGRAVRIPRSPQKIVSLAPSITEILFALGLKKEIAAVTDFCDYPAEASKKPRIGGFVNPNNEKIVSLQPDLVIGIADGNRIDTIQRLSELGVPVYVMDPKGFDGIMNAVGNIGEIVGRPENSKKITAEMRGKREQIAASTKSLPRPKVFFQISFPPLVTGGKGSLADELIRLAGGESVSENEWMLYPPYSFEMVVQKAPEIIILSSMESKGDQSRVIEKWRKWKSIPAVKRNAIHVVDSNIVSRPTPRIVEGLEAVARILHPEVFKK